MRTRENVLVHSTNTGVSMLFDNANKFKGIVATAVVCAGGTGVAAGCGGDKTASAGSSGSSTTTTASVLPQGSEPANLDPADFTTNIDNPYFPMQPGNKWVYDERDTVGSQERVVVEVTDKTKMIANGVEARVVRDTVTENGVPVEITDDWYAQDSAGNIWYLGEYVTNYENGKVIDHAGSFEAGVDGAEAGVAMPANPEAGMEYRQEYYAGEAEDEGAVVTVGQEQVQVPFGFFDSDILMTRDLVPTEPKVEELKFYAPGVGPLLSIHVDGTGGRSELVSFTQGS